MFEAGDTLHAMQAKVAVFEHQTEFLDKINTKKDPTKWEMTPQVFLFVFVLFSNERANE